ncbi:hypothetical protein ACFYWX_01345 [Streptomyces sp. NPDC002888]|uniref:hypothetical protein n=1 Tax=Streptomyces sp. NPDC002888 TaxID=3364668 RepID=UPI003697CC9F
MTSVSAAELLDAWEAGWGRDPLRRGLALLAVARGTTRAAAADVPVGLRDRALFAFRAALFGTGVEAVSRCPGCGTDVEVAFDQRDLLDAMPVPAPVSVSGQPVPGTVTVRVGGRDVPVRMPTSADLAAVLDADPPAPDEALAHRCAPTAPVGAVAEAWLAADPLLDPRIDLDCPDCEHTWEETFDIVGFLWAELDTWGRRTLQEVHDLARAYGWSEADTLALSPWRRQCYLGLVGA